MWLLYHEVAPGPETPLRNSFWLHPTTKQQHTDVSANQHEKFQNWCHKRENSNQSKETTSVALLKSNPFVVFKNASLDYPLGFEKVPPPQKKNHTKARSGEWGGCSSKVIFLGAPGTVGCSGLCEQASHHGEATTSHPATLLGSSKGLNQVNSWVFLSRQAD